MTFDIARYERFIRMNAHKQAMDDREDYQDGDINEPEQPVGDFDDNVDEPPRPADDIDEHMEDINVEEELVRPMSQLQSQETPRNSQQQGNSQQTETRKSVRSQGSSFIISILLFEILKIYYLKYFY